MLEKIEADTVAIHDTGSDGALSETNEAERNKMGEWNKKDKEMDVMADDIIAGIKKVRHNVNLINDAQDELENKQKPVAEKMDKLSARIKKDNDQLKEIIEQVHTL